MLLRRFIRLPTVCIGAGERDAAQALEFDTGGFQDPADPFRRLQVAIDSSAGTLEALHRGQVHARPFGQRSGRPVEHAAGTADLMGRQQRNADPLVFQTGANVHQNVLNSGKLVSPLWAPLWPAAGPRRRLI